MENCLSYPLEEIFFADELLKAIKILPNDKFEKLFNDLENRINKTYKYFEKYFCFTILRRDWNKMPTDMELRLAKDLENNINCGNSNTFGLQEMMNLKNFAIEGFFNKLDLNISLSLKQSKLQLASGKILKEDLTLDLKEIHT
ncbi:hypothetical protein GLOIN_2v1790670 [Rhizophagus irregularis DAOM 181602=DAOM 197198]|uniref:Uncharacterized protein n=1 Tax=Rhizophagus irregularis (strain DAOM 181602 / DAOM 197198 / MUCL 43194) TaxID=747089 RepID=A0A2P4NYL3_RHIID|nr:hypothetical protein GLOIN_2v1790670 [Rhizophagus irregularis DAOM 181602=DAOM 197198]POG58231.1 hypothetical protein GLOIN_2v1790670 [Rhizophagus irregularis DAOM 181602=DAOM 197198]CAG8685473.1 2921_t:CDS:2 [Rhizophagus irregularis]|eukprot:XP_025165097.1 hypothetical protein GLOIN_2v1790670 [Rhizophagus irregularis DAOM 181602=DAOM 197198]